MTQKIKAQTQAKTAEAAAMLSLFRDQAPRHAKAETKSRKRMQSPEGSACILYQNKSKSEYHAMKQVVCKNCAGNHYARFSFMFAMLTHTDTRAMFHTYTRLYFGETRVRDKKEECSHKHTYTDAWPSSVWRLLSVVDKGDREFCTQKESWPLYMS